jgi:hypothetical protein
VLFTQRNSRRSLLIETNPYQVLAAGFDRPNGTGVVIDCAAEFEVDDETGLRQWIAANFERPNTWVPTIASFVPPEALLQRESLQPRKLGDPAYLVDLVRDQYKIENPANWRLQALSPLEGELVAPEGTQRPALLCGVSQTDVNLMQQRLLDQRLLPYRLEVGILPLVGAIADYQKRQNEKRAVVVVVIEQEHTTAFVVGKEGVQTPAPVRHGFTSIVNSARREFDLKNADDVRARLHHADDELLLRASKFVRAIGRDLKPLVDSYEMTTGQPVGEIYCAYLPPALAWIAEPLAQVIGRSPMYLDHPAWRSAVGISLANDVTPPGAHWLGALSLVAQQSATETEKAPKADAPYQGRWRIDCRSTASLPSGDLIRRRFLTNALAATFAAAAAVFTIWLFYLGDSSEKDADFWSQRIADNKAAVDAINAASRHLGADVAQLETAAALVGSPYRLTEYLVTLGRLRPAAMQISNIDSIENGVILRGVLHEPSDKARLTLNAHIKELMADPLLNRAFASVSLTSFNRQDLADSADESFDFELTFKLKPAP